MVVSFEPSVVLATWLRTNNSISTQPDGDIMKANSIRQFLLINLLLTITIITTISSIFNYFLDRADIERHLDSVLAQTTVAFSALLSDGVENRDIEKIQTQLNRIPVLSKQIFDRLFKDRPNDQFRQRFIFQVWSADNQLLMKTPGVTDKPLSIDEGGFSEVFIQHQPWRVFTLRSDITHETIMVAERYDIRAELAHNIARDDIYTMLIVYPILGLLIWVVIGRGLRTILLIANQIRERAPAFLEPVDLERVPKEVKPLIDELNKLFLRLQEGFEREKRFSADAAHELRTPLAALKTHAQIALKATDRKESQKAISHVITGVDRTTHVVQQLLTLSRMHPEVVHLENPIRVDIAKLTAETLAQLAPSALEKSIELELICNKDHVMIEGNPTALDILIRNLVDNAIRYTPKQGCVKVTIEKSSQHVILRVVDNGPGIPAELRQRVFERFFRVLGTRVTGSGLGLAIVSQIVQLHQAEIELGAGPNDVGLEVKVTFPTQMVV